MTLATDLLKRYPPAPRKPKQKRPPSAKWAMHTVRIPGIRQVRKGWHASVVSGRREVFLGMHDTPHRAQLAIRLYQLWEERGYTEIPRQQGYTAFQ